MKTIRGIDGTELVLTGPKGPPLRGSPPEEIARHVAYHEAGHAVVAHALGMRVVAIEPCESGYRVAVECEDGSALAHFNMAAMTMAGGAAQTNFGVDPDEGCHQDLQQAVKHALTYLGHDTDPERWAEGLPPEVDAVVRNCGELAMDIVQARWNAVSGIAHWLMGCGGRMDEAQLAAVLAP